MYRLKVKNHQRKNQKLIVIKKNIILIIQNIEMAIGQTPKTKMTMIMVIWIRIQIGKQKWHYVKNYWKNNKD